MLNKKDLQEIESLIVKNVTHILGEFFEKSLAPYLDKQFKENEEDHEEIFRRLDKNDLEHVRIFEKMDRLEKGQTKLEAGQAKNNKEHTRIMEKLNILDNHEERIKGLEKVASN